MMMDIDTKEKVPAHDAAYESNGSHDQDFEAQPAEGGKLSRELKGRHMQMIAIGMFAMPLQPMGTSN